MRKKDIEVMQFWMQSQSGCRPPVPTYPVVLRSTWKLLSNLNYFPQPVKSAKFVFELARLAFRGWALVLHFPLKQFNGDSRKTLPCAGRPVVAFPFNLADLNHI